MRGSVSVWRALVRAREDVVGNDSRPAPEGLTRRRVLTALGGGAVASVLPWQATPAQGAPRVAVVGGGLAGLSALWHLRRAGVEAVLYEARGATGGRTRSVRDAFGPGHAVDEGAQLVNTDHADLLRFIRLFGIRLVDRRAYGVAHEYQIGPGGGLVAEAELARSLRGIAAHITRDADRLDRDYEGTAREIDPVSVAAYLDRHGMARGAARDALEAGIRTEYGVEPEHASALQLLFNLPTVDGQRVTHISGSDERYLVDGGTARIAEALTARLRPFIRTGKRLTAAEIGEAGVRLAFADGEEVRADRVIMAMPAPLYRDLRIEGPVPELWRALLGEIDYGRNEKLMMGYDAQPWRATMGFGGAVWSGAHFSAIWDAASSRPQGGAGALTYFLGGDQVGAVAAEENRALAARFHQRAGGVLHGLPAPNGRIRRTRWSEDPLTKGAYVNFRPGQLTRFGSLLSVDADGATRASGFGPVFFAGEWLSDAYPGYMNGAVQTGRLAAQALVRSLRMPRRRAA